MSAPLWAHTEEQDPIAELMGRARKNAGRDGFRLSSLKKEKVHV